MAEPLISVIVNTYNYGRFVEEAIDSALGQDFPSEQMEILVVDDGSTDDTAERVKKYGERVRYLYKENGDQCSAIPFGVERAKGELVAFLDGDDVWLPHKLARVAQEFARSPRAVMLYHRYIYWNSRDNSTWEPGYFAEVSGDVLADRRKLIAFTGAPTSSLIFRRDAFEPLTRIPAGRAFSYDTFLLSAAVFLGPVACIPEVLTKNRIHGNNRFEAAQAGPGAATSQRRVARWGAMIEILGDWTRENAPESAQPQARLLLRRWRLVLEEHQFALKAPGRVEFFRYQIEANRLTSAARGPKLRAINWLNALASLVTGYRHFGALDAFWRKLDHAKAGLAPAFSRTGAGEQPGRTP
jgi:glycosyltransferase involved in cell wall biosynthesis